MKTMSMQMIEAAVFDFDGVIVDSETAGLRALEQLYNEYGVDPRSLRQAFVSSSGRHPRPDHLAMLRQRIPLPHLEDIDGKRRTYRNSFLEEMGLRPGLKSWLLEARQSNLKAAVASNAPSDWVSPWLERFGIRECFDIVQCRQPHIRPKPYPDLYLASCLRLAVEPGNAVAIEDSSVGLKAAKSAGMQTLAVPTEITVYSPIIADTICKDMSGASLVDLLGI